MTTNQDGPSADDFAMKVWREALEAGSAAWSQVDRDYITDAVRVSAALAGTHASTRVLSEAFDKVRTEGVEQGRAEERARVVAWLQREAGKTHECYEHVLLDAATAITTATHVIRAQTVAEEMAPCKNCGFVENLSG